MEVLELLRDPPFSEDLPLTHFNPSLTSPPLLVLVPAALSEERRQQLDEGSQGRGWMLWYVQVVPQEETLLH
jgi:hypothetical protein